MECLACLPLCPGTDLLPLAVGGELLGGDKDAEFEDGLQLGRKPLGLKVLELGLGLPDEGHIEAQAEHVGGSCFWRRGRRECCLPRHPCTRYAGAQLSLAASALPFGLIEKKKACSLYFQLTANEHTAPRGGGHCLGAKG